MAKAKALYSTIGVPENATADEIKRAYKKKAMALHPDRPTGDEEKFKELSTAMVVLLDPLRRKRYDETGDTTDENSSAAQMLNQITSMMLNIIEKTPDVDKTDLIGICKQIVNQTMADMAAHQTKIEKQSEKLERAIKRLNKKNQGRGENKLVQLLRGVIKDNERKIESLEESRSKQRDILAILDEYVYVFDEWDAGQGVQIVFRSNP